ncbi:MAG: protein phosphatase 2C domain-containing protein, partial [Kiritimatiellaeota bacterium]|nr:protein phosphatase 2C domain-containing protein [Kiritimatiellota bacterium]
MTSSGTAEFFAGGSGAFAHLSFAALTDTGRRRANNEDAFAVLPAHGACFVADGMGGAADGEVASKAAVDALEEAFGAFPPGRPLAPAAKLAWGAGGGHRAAAGG